MTWGLTAIAAATTVSALASSSAAKKAAATQAAAATESTAAQTAAADRSAELQYKIWQEQKALQEPWRQAGLLGLNKLIPAAAEYTPFGQQQFKADPGYAFRMSEGLKGLERSAAARGGLLSGSTLKGIERYGQDLASQEYQNAFNRYQAERQAQLQPLQSLAGLGQTSTQALSGAAGTYGSNVGNIYQNIGQAQAAGISNAASARASGYLGSANALNQALGQGINLYGMYNQNQIMNRIFPPA